MVGDILQPTHLLFVLVVALVVLGPKRLPEVGRSLGRGIRDFKVAISGEDQSPTETLPDHVPSEETVPSRVPGEEPGHVTSEAPAPSSVAPEAPVPGTATAEETPPAQPPAQPTR